MEIITLFNTLLEEIFLAEQNFFENMKDMYQFEEAMKEASNKFATGFMGMVLSSIDSQLRNDGWRKEHYNIQRKDERTLISSVGEIKFDCTLFKNKATGEHSFLLEKLINLNKRERFTESAEVAVLSEAIKSSYSNAASVIPTESPITKTTVMNMVHKYAMEYPDNKKDQELKQHRFLYVEADEDHVSEQHGRWSPKEENKGFLSRVAYVYEYKREVPNCKGRKELVNKVYFSGLYPGSKGVKQFWEKVWHFVEETYDTEYLEKIYLSGDGASWIKSGLSYLDKAVFCIDKFHLMKYINAATNPLKEKTEEAKGQIYRMLYEHRKKDLMEYLNLLADSIENEKPVLDLQSFVSNNWEAIMRSLHDKNVEGCSAEGHVNHLLSERLSTKALAWSQEGADAISRLRAYVQNNGEERIIELVNYRREKACMKKTGTDNMEPVVLSAAKVMNDHYKQARSYVDRIQATIGGPTVRKIISIRNRLREM